MSNCLYSLDNTLHYVYPVNCCWMSENIPIGLQVPESHELFIVPLSCGRPASLTTLLQGTNERLSLYVLEERDLVTGDYEQLIVEVVDELLASLPRRPRALFVIVTCLANLIGIDYGPVIAEIKRRHPDTKIGLYNLETYSLEHKMAPIFTMQEIVYGYLDPCESREAAVNFIGNHFGLPYVVGLAMGERAGSCVNEALVEAASSGHTVVVGADVAGDAVLFLGEQVQGNSLRRACERACGLPVLRVGAIYGLEKTLAASGDLNLKTERDIRAEMNSGYRAVVADPLFRPLLRGDGETEFVDFPSIAVSSRLSWDRVHRFIDGKTDALVERLCALASSA